MGEGQQGILDDLPDAYLFNVEMVPQWSKKYSANADHWFFASKQLHGNQSHIGEKSRQFSMIVGRLYKQGQDSVL